MRRSSLPLPVEPSGAPEAHATPAGRPDREVFLHLQEATDVIEAIRRVWLHSLSSVPAAPAAVLVQRFVPAEASAVVGPARDRKLLDIRSAHGLGDLLAAGLLAPDRHLVRRDTGVVVSRRIGRKAHVSVPNPDGGTMRMPLPAEAAGQPALSEARLKRTAELWIAAEAAANAPLQMLGVAFAGDDAAVTGVALAEPRGQEMPG